MRMGKKAIVKLTMADTRKVSVASYLQFPRRIKRFGKIMATSAALSLVVLGSLFGLQQEEASASWGPARFDTGAIGNGYKSPIGDPNERVVWLNAKYLALDRETQTSSGCANADTSRYWTHYLDGGYDAHLGIDLDVVGNPVGNVRINAIDSGTVLDVQYPYPGLGAWILVEHQAGNDKKFQVNYGHVDPTVRKGDPVTAGQKIGTQTRLWDGSDHLHMELRPTSGDLTVTAAVRANVDRNGNCSVPPSLRDGTVNPKTFLNNNPNVDTRPNQQGASTTAYRVTGTGGSALNVRSCASTDCRFLGTVPASSYLSIICQTDGQAVTGNWNGRTIAWSKWNKIELPVPYRPGSVGYVADLYTNTPANHSIPKC